MIEIVKIILRGMRYADLYDSQKIPLAPGEHCLAESSIGLQIGCVTSVPRLMKKRFVEKELPKVIRKTSEADIEQLKEIAVLEEEAFKFCEERALSRKLVMKLVRVTFAFDRSKALFMFTADGRVDFRELVRDLAHHLKTRIEMKQIGIRDEARLLGGIGICGCNLCCQRFLRSFHPVSIKMAKDQGLSLIPSKISGYCGRLMCCLQYEHSTYAELMRTLPRIGRLVKTPAGEGRVRQVNILQSKLMVEIGEGDIKEFESKDITLVYGDEPIDSQEADLSDIEYSDEKGFNELKE
jgi:cell fate regulator YaaT (PSP1 superfamily)